MPNRVLTVGKKKINQSRKVELVKRNADLLQEFLDMGYKSFIAFHTIMSYKDDFYKSDLGYRVLRSFWEVRIRQVDLLDEIENMLHNLKNS